MWRRRRSESQERSSSLSTSPGLDDYHEDPLPGLSGGSPEGEEDRDEEDEDDLLGGWEVEESSGGGSMDYDSDGVRVEAEVAGDGVVRVRFEDLGKPGRPPRVSSPGLFKRFLALVQAEEAMEGNSPISESGLSPSGRMMGAGSDTAPLLLSPASQAERDKEMEEMRLELAQVEEEISTLRQVLGAKVLRSQELKRKLGITVWREFTDDMSQGLRNVKESNVYIKAGEKFSDFHQAVTSAPLYQKTESAIKATAEKTTTLLGGLGQKLGQLKNSDSFRSLEERVSTTVTTVKSKMSGSRSNSMQGFDEALAAHEAAVGGSHKSTNGTPATTPTSIPESKPL